jgi:hypothetical protein
MRPEAAADYILDMLRPVDHVRPRPTERSSSTEQQLPS